MQHFSLNSFPDIEAMHDYTPDRRKLPKLNCQLHLSGSYN
jgi:hypothetical protein